ncbi:MAG: tetratricopeptide repeat protein, partial [Candidatus Hydrogenedentota bacterium]
MALLASLMVGVASPAEARELNPYQLRALYRLYVTATYKAQTGDWAGALKDFQAAANLAPRSAEILLQLARAYYHTSQIKQAERYAHLALEADSSASEAYVILGEIALAAEDAAAADSYFSQRLRWEPNDDQTRLRLGFLREEAGDLEGVVEVLTDFPPQRRGAATAHYHRGLALVRLGRYDEAISAFRTVVNLVPDHTDSYRFLALLEEQQGRDEEALEDWGTVLNLDPNNIQALRHRIDLLLERNRVKKAREDLLRLSRLTAGDSGGVDPDALLYQYAMEEGNYGAAARALLRVARKKNAGETTFLQAALLASRGEGDTEIVIEALEGAYRVSGKEALGHLAART